MRPILVNHKKTIEALADFERKFSEEHGPFSFFGFLWTAYDDYNQSGGHWNVTAAAPWSKDDEETQKAFRHGVRAALAVEQWFMTPGTTLLAPNSPGLEPIHDALEIEHDLAELIDVELFGKDIRRAYIITSQRLAPAVAEGQE